MAQRGRLGQLGPCLIRESALRRTLLREMPGSGGEGWYFLAAGLIGTCIDKAAEAQGRHRTSSLAL